MNVERLGLKEVRRLRNIRTRAVRNAPEAFESSPEDIAALSEERWLNQLSKLPTFVAVEGGQDVGMIRGDMDREDQDRRWLISMWVAPEARGRGVGDALIERLLQWAREDGAKSVLLEVGDHNAHAIALYARHGFEFNGHRTTLAPPRQHVTEHQREKIL